MLKEKSLNFSTHITEDIINDLNTMYLRNTCYDSFILELLGTVSSIALDIADEYVILLDNDDAFSKIIFKETTSLDIFDYILNNTNLVEKISLYENECKRDLELVLLENEEIFESMYFENLDDSFLYNFLGKLLSLYIKDNNDFLIHLFNSLGKNLVKKHTSIKSYLIPKSYFHASSLDNYEVLNFIANYLFIRNLSFDYIKNKLFYDTMCIIKDFNTLYSYHDYDDTLSKYSKLLQKNYIPLKNYFFTHFKTIAIKHNISYETLKSNKQALTVYFTNLFCSFTDLDLENFNCMYGYDELISTLL